MRKFSNCFNLVLFTILFPIHCIFNVIFTAAINYFSAAKSVQCHLCIKAIKSNSTVYTILNSVHSYHSNLYIFIFLQHYIDVFCYFCFIILLQRFVSTKKENITKDCTIKVQPDSEKVDSIENAKKKKIPLKIQFTLYYTENTLLTNYMSLSISFILENIH